MLALLSPAKKLNLDPAPTGLPYSQPVLLDQTERLLKTVRRLSARKLASLMNLSDKLATLNHQRYQQFSLPHTPENAKQAGLLFAGDTYLGLEAGTLSQADLEYAQHHLRIISGLYGLLRPLDLVQPYRLEMGTRLKTRRGGALYDFWGERLTKALNQELAGQSDKTIVNLASNEYFKALSPGKLNGRLIDCEFKELREGKLKIISFFAKRARGMMARHIISQRIDTAEGLRSFESGGYQFREELSSDDRFTFTRES